MCWLISSTISVEITTNHTEFTVSTTAIIDVTIHLQLLSLKLEDSSIANCKWAKILTCKLIIHKETSEKRLTFEISSRQIYPGVNHTVGIVQIIVIFWWTTECKAGRVIPIWHLIVPWWAQGSQEVIIGICLVWFLACCHLGNLKLTSTCLSLLIILQKLQWEQMAEGRWQCLWLLIITITFFGGKYHYRNDIDICPSSWNFQLCVEFFTSSCFIKLVIMLIMYKSK